ncbi:hypothetical protein ACJJTC_008737 [Scirpophaga incertulas]
MWIFRGTAFLLYFSLVVTQELDIDINRITRLTSERNNLGRYHVKTRRNILGNHFERSYYKNRYAQLKNLKSLNVHPPREDPRIFYQSNSYIKENSENLNKEVSAIYPGREVIRAQNIQFNHPQLALDQQGKEIDFDTNNCVRCPNDRTIIAKLGSDLVVLHTPLLQTCTGQKAPSNVRIVSTYGPTFGSLLGRGSHVIIGRISRNNKILQMCKMQVHVITQDCPVPRDLISKCDERNKVCTFSCRNPQLELHGDPSLSCENGLGWTGDLPICRARTWCYPPPPPSNGHLSCNRGTFKNGTEFPEGSTCRIRCPVGLHWHPRAATACRRGDWTFELNCQSNRYK